MDAVGIALDILLPALGAGIVLAIAWRVWRPGGPEVDGRWSGAPALALAFALGFVSITGLPASPLPGGDRSAASLDWLFWLALVAALALPFEQRLGRWRDMARGAFAVLAIQLVLRSQFESAWEGMDGVAWIAGLTVGYVFLWAALVLLAERRAGASMPIVAWLTASGLALLAVLTGSGKIGQLSGSLAAGLGAATVLCWWRPRLSLGAGGAGMVALLLFGLGANAHFYSYALAADVVLVGSAPLVAHLADVGPLRRVTGWKRTVLVLVIASVPIAVAVTRAVLAYEPDPYADYY